MVQSNEVRPSKRALIPSIPADLLGLTLDLQNTNNLSNSNIPKSENNIMISSGVDKISQSGQVII